MNDRGHALRYLAPSRSAAPRHSRPLASPAAAFLMKDFNQMTYARFKLSIYAGWAATTAALAVAVAHA